MEHNNDKLNQENVEIIEQYEKKKTNKLFIFIVCFLLLIGCILGMFIIFNNNETKKNNKDNYEIEYDEDTEIVFKNYKFKLLDNYESFNNDQETGIKSKEYFFIYADYPASYNQIINNQEELLEELKHQGYTISTFENFDKDSKYVLIEASKKDIEYGFVFYELDSDTNLFITITSNYLAHFNKSWFNETLEFLKTGIKIEQ